MILAGRAALVVLLATLPLFVMACSGKRPTDPASKALRAKTIFKGKLLERPSNSEAVFKVLKRFRDDTASLPRRQGRVTVTGPVRCGLQELHTGQLYLVFAKAVNSSSGAALQAVAAPEEFKRKTAKVVKNAIKNANCKGCVKPAKASGLNETTSAREGKPLTLKCLVSGNPAPTVIWFKDGQKLKSKGRISIKSKRKLSVLKIQSARLQDSGKYECRASNIKGESVNYTRVTIYPKVPPPPPPPPTTTTTGKPCPEATFCLNGGTCIFYPSLQELTCQCAEGFKGYRCENKNVIASGISRLWPMATLDATQVQSSSKVWPKGAAARISVDLDETTRMLQRYWGK